LTIQITIVRLEGYGPWTLTLGSDREATLQMLQAKIYYDIQRLFSQKKGLAYSNRFDEYFVITNGISMQDHLEIKNELDQQYKNLKLSMMVGYGLTPFEANRNAHIARKSSEQTYRTVGIFGKTIPSSSSPPSSGRSHSSFVQLMHIDIDHSTEVGSILSPYEITCLVSKIYSRLSDEFLRKESMTFFIGGDNFMVISNGSTNEDAKRVIEMITADLNIKLNCGIGIAMTGRQAAEAATQALDTVRILRNQGKIQSLYQIKCL
jgi:GTP cyclohydrolase IIa